MLNFVKILLFVALLVNVVYPSDKLHIKIVREKLANNLLTGKIFYNNKVIGRSYENNELNIRAGKYKGSIMWASNKDQVIGPLGNVGKEGEFLLKIGDAEWLDGKKRKNLLLHSGFDPRNPNGCIMLGYPYKKNRERHTLERLRKEIYGTEDSKDLLEKKVIVEVVDFPFGFEGKWEASSPSTRILISFKRENGIITGEMVFKDTKTKEIQKLNKLKLLENRLMEFEFGQGEMVTLKLHLKEEYFVLDFTGTTTELKFKKVVMQ